MSKKRKTQNKKSEITVYPIVRIEWLDHVGSDFGWVMHKSDLKPRAMRVFTVGMVVYEDDEIITVAQTMSEMEQLSMTMTILKNCIKHTEHLGNLRYVQAKKA